MRLLQLADGNGAPGIQVCCLTAAIYAGFVCAAASTVWISFARPCAPSGGFACCRSCAHASCKSLFSACWYHAPMHKACVTGQVKPFFQQRDEAIRGTPAACCAFGLFVVQLWVGFPISGSRKCRFELVGAGPLIRWSTDPVIRSAGPLARPGDDRW